MFFKRAGKPRLESDPTGGKWQSVQGLLWMSRSPVEPGWWAAVHAQHARTGLWPLFLKGLTTAAPLRPWESGELDRRRAASDPGDHEVAGLLREWFEGQMPPDEEREEMSEIIAPFLDGWPGLAPPGTGPDPDDNAAETAELLVDFGRCTDARLGLVRCVRGADIPALIGWAGTVNHEDDTARISAVLRSWEERFGARLLALGFDTMILAVAAPPHDLDHARLVAAEHLAFCPDTITQGTESLESYATELAGATQWEFWWD